MSFSPDPEVSFPAKIFQLFSIHAKTQRGQRRKVQFDSSWRLCTLGVFAPFASLREKFFRLGRLTNLAD